MKVIEKKIDYTSPNCKVFEIQGTNAILTGSNEPGRVPGAQGLSVEDDEYDY